MFKKHVRNLKQEKQSMRQIILTESVSNQTQKIDLVKESAGKHETMHKLH